MHRCFLFYLLLLCSGFANAREVRSVPVPSAERQNFQWFAANTVWMHGPTIGWVQASDLDNAVGRHRSAVPAVWSQLVPQAFISIVQQHLGTSFLSDDFIQHDWIYTTRGRIVAERSNWNDSRGRLRAELLVFSQERSEDSFLRFFNSNGAQLLELSFRESEWIYLDVFEYRETQLMQVRRLDSSANEEYRDLFSYRDEGALRLVERRYPDGSTRSSQYGFHHGILRDELHRLQDGSMLLVRFDGSGRIREERIFREEILIEQTVFTYESDLMRHPLGSETDFPDSNRRIVRSYENGLVVSEMEYAGSNVIISSGWDYSEDRRLVRHWTEHAGQRETREFVYTVEGDLDIERLLINDELQEERRFDGLAETLEMYRRGEVVLRVYYHDSRRIREEVLHAGEIIRVREFE